MQRQDYFGFSRMREKILTLTFLFFQRRVTVMGMKSDVPREGEP